MLYPTKPSQYHQPADGLGHLIQFPVEELKKHSGRLLDIMVSNGMTIEPVSEKIWGWQRSIIAWEVNPDFLGVEWLDAAIDEINSYILPGNRDLPSKYKDIFANFLDIMIVKLAEKGQTGGREKILLKLINDLNKNLLQKDSQEMSFEWFVNFLRKAGWDEPVDAYNDFIQPKTREDIYWEQEWEVSRKTWEHIEDILEKNWWEWEKVLVINPGRKSKISV